MLNTTRPRFSLKPTLRRVGCQIDALFDRILLEPEDRSCRLKEGMRYAMKGGKRLRPLLVMASASLFGVRHSQSLRAGLAAECIHVQSLIHDDLPCMDDDDLRRGSPTLHKAFDETTAVLAGDALLALAFQLLASPDVHPDGAVRSTLISELATSVGPFGMAAGQMLDLTTSEDRSLQDIMRMQRLKTGALLAWCADAGAILGSAAPDQRKALRGYAYSLGLAFQIADDLLDVEGDEAAVGKRLGKDEEQGKTTLISFLGPERARAQAEFLVSQGIEHLTNVPGDTQLLEAIARFAVTRNH